MAVAQPLVNSLPRHQNDVVATLANFVVAFQLNGLVDALHPGLKGRERGMRWRVKKDQCLINSSKSAAAIRAPYSMVRTTLPRERPRLPWRR